MFSSLMQVKVVLSGLRIGLDVIIIVVYSLRSVLHRQQLQSAM